MDKPSKTGIKIKVTPVHKKDRKSYDIVNVDEDETLCSDDDNAKLETTDATTTRLKRDRKPSLKMVLKVSEGKEERSSPKKQRFKSKAKDSNTDNLSDETNDDVIVQKSSARLKQTNVLTEDVSETESRTTMRKMRKTPREKRKGSKAVDATVDSGQEDDDLNPDGAETEAAEGDVTTADETEVTHPELEKAETKSPNYTKLRDNGGKKGLGAGNAKFL